MYLAATLVLVAILAACNKHESNSDLAEQNLELRAKNLGFSDVEAYKVHVAQQCEAGIHNNCDPYTDGTHHACAYNEHSGTKHDGSHHNGTSHGSHDGNGHSHGSHGNGHN